MSATLIAREIGFAAARALREELSRLSAHGEDDVRAAARRTLHHLDAWEAADSQSARVARALVIERRVVQAAFTNTWLWTVAIVLASELRRLAAVVDTSDGAN